MTRADRISTRIIAVLDIIARLPVYALVVAAAVLVIATANDAPRVTPAATTTHTTGR